MGLGFGIVQGLANFFFIEPDSKQNVLGLVGREAYLRILCKCLCNKRENTFPQIF